MSKNKSSFGDDAYRMNPEASLFSRKQEGDFVVAAFDFDGTITYCDSLFPFLHFLSGTPRFIGKSLQVFPSFLSWKFGRLTRQQAKENALASFLGGYSEEELRHVAQQYVLQRLPKLIRPKALERIRWHREQGHICVLISASIDLYLAPWVESIGFDVLLCSQLEFQSGKTRGRLRGLNCWGEEKVRRLRELFPDRTEYELYAYGDTEGDRPLLKDADHGFYRPFR